MDIAKAELEGEKRQIAYLDLNLFLYKKAGFSGLTIGMLLTIIGFALWYRRVQRYQDAILKAQYTETIKPK